MVIRFEKSEVKKIVRIDKRVGENEVTLFEFELLRSGEDTYDVYGMIYYKCAV